MEVDMEISNPSHYFIDACSPGCGRLAILGYPNRFIGHDIEVTTFYTTRGGEWRHLKFDFDSRSVAHTGDPSAGNWWVLGKRGEALDTKKDQADAERMPEAGTGKGRYGYMERMINIGETLYACGDSRQVYRRDPKRGWVDIAGPMRAKSTSVDATFEAMDGTAPDNIYAVGDHGQVWRYDGRKWTRCDVPTNLHLYEVKCVSSDEVWMCGEKGALIRGSKDTWSVLIDDERDGDLWGLESFMGKMYAAGDDGVFRINGQEFQPVTIGKRKMDGYRLRSGGDQLYSIGQDHLYSFDGKTWTELVCPDNIKSKRK